MHLLNSQKKKKKTTAMTNLHHIVQNHVRLIFTKQEYIGGLKLSIEIEALAIKNARPWIASRAMLLRYRKIMKTIKKEAKYIFTLFNSSTTRCLLPRPVSPEMPVNISP